jgi:hypothetical protein
MYTSSNASETFVEKTLLIKFTIFCSSEILKIVSNKSRKLNYIHTIQQVLWHLLSSLGTCGDEVETGQLKDSY